MASPKTQFLTQIEKRLEEFAPEKCKDMSLKTRIQLENDDANQSNFMAHFDSLDQLASKKVANMEKQKNKRLRKQLATLQLRNRIVEHGYKDYLSMLFTLSFFLFYPFFLFLETIAIKVAGLLGNENSGNYDVDLGLYNIHGAITGNVDECMRLHELLDTDMETVEDCHIRWTYNSLMRPIPTLIQN